MFKIDKSFDLCYGHRVHVQKLNADYAMHAPCACRHLHGHQAKVTVYLESEDLNDQSMVTDFKHLGWAKKMIDTELDHKFILHAGDPLTDMLLPKDVAVTPVTVTVGKATFCIGGRPVFDNQQHPASAPLDAIKEMFEGILVVNFVPTSENLAHWMYEITSFFMEQINVRVSQVDWWETPKSRSSFVA